MRVCTVTNTDLCTLEGGRATVKQNKKKRAISRIAAMYSDVLLQRHLPHVPLPLSCATAAALRTLSAPVHAWLLLSTPVQSESLLSPLLLLFIPCFGFLPPGQLQLMLLLPPLPLLRLSRLSLVGPLPHPTAASSLALLCMPAETLTPH
jgi:hypothetical protein